MQEPKWGRHYINEEVFLIPGAQVSDPESQYGRQQEQGVKAGQAAEEIGERALHRNAHENKDTHDIADQAETGDDGEDDSLSDVCEGSLILQVAEGFVVSRVVCSSRAGGGTAQAEVGHAD